MTLDVFPRLLFELLPGVKDIEESVIDDREGDVEDVVKLDRPDVINIRA